MVDKVLSDTKRTTSKYVRVDKSHKVAFLHSVVLAWVSEHGRDFPWRRSTNPYNVYVAEVLLRQTQADRVVDPYLDLVAAYPNVEAMASANVDELRQWFKPLGLVTRADNLVRAATLILRDYNGVVPNDLDALLALPGVGAYSARAILCLSFDQRVPMIDESSGRLLRRIFGLLSRRPAYSDKELLKIASNLLPEKSHREFNLGLLDLAAQFCHAREPSCDPCPLFQLCDFGSVKVIHDDASR